MIYKGNCCKFGCQADLLSKSAANNPNIDNPEANNSVRYNPKNDKVVISNLRGGYSGKQIITRKAIHRHFNIELSSSNLADFVSEDECSTYKKKRKCSKLSKCAKCIAINHCCSTNSAITSPNNETYSHEESSRFQNRQRSKTRYFFNKSEGHDANTFPLTRKSVLQSPVHRGSEITQNEPKSGVFSKSDGKRSCKYKVVFSNRATSDTSSTTQPSKQDPVRKKDESIRRNFMDVRYIEGST